MIDAEFMAQREDTIRPDEAPAIDTSTESQDPGAQDDGGFQAVEDGEAAPPPVVGMTSDPDGEALPPIVEADPTFDVASGFQLTLDLDDLPLPGFGFVGDYGFFG